MTEYKAAIDRIVDIWLKLGGQPEDFIPFMEYMEKRLAKDLMGTFFRFTMGKHVPDKYEEIPWAKNHDKQT